MTTLAVAINQAQKKVTFINWKHICISGIAIALFLLFFYAIQINELAKISYFQGLYEKELESLLKEHNDLKISLENNNFLENSLLKLKNLNFQKATLIKYIQISPVTKQTAMKK